MVTVAVVAWGMTVAIVSAVPAQREPSPASVAGLSELNMSGLEALRAPRWGRDPFDLPSKEEAMAGTLVLSAILYHPDSKLAIVNGHLVGVGGDIDGRRVMSIGPDHIGVREGKSTRRLEVSKFTTEQSPR